MSILFHFLDPYITFSNDIFLVGRCWLESVTRKYVCVCVCICLICDNIWVKRWMLLVCKSPMNTTEDMEQFASFSTFKSLNLYNSPGNLIHYCINCLFCHHQIPNFQLCLPLNYYKASKRLRRVFKRSLNFHSIQMLFSNCSI